MKKQRIVGLGFRAKSGKDATADALVREFGVVKMAFADPLKTCAKTIFGWTDAHVYGDLKEVVDPYWGFTPRWALQKLGTEGVRDVIGKDTWVKSARRRIENTLSAPGVAGVVFTDVRFPEEAALVKDLGGEVWHVYRASLGPLALDAHESEVAMLKYPWDRVIENDGSLRDLEVLASLTWREGDREITAVTRRPAPPETPDAVERLAFISKHGDSPVERVE